MDNFSRLPGSGSAFRRVDIVHKPGMADALLREMAPLLAAEGIDVNDPSTFTDATLNAALQRAAERKNLELVTATGAAREHALSVLHSAAWLLSDDLIAELDSLVELIEPKPTDPRFASVAQTIGVALGVLDKWSTDRTAAAMLPVARAPKWSDRARNAAADIMDFARDGRAFDSMRELIIKNGGYALLEGSLLAVAGTVIVWAESEDENVLDFAERVVV